MDQQAETLVVTALELALGEPNFKFIKPNETTFTIWATNRQIIN
jgi:hypothetical protein